MPEDSMTPRERWLAVLRREQPDRVPMDYWATGEATRKLMQHVGCDTTTELFETLHIDAVVSVGPPIPSGEDVFGCRFRNVEYGTGVYAECVHNPLAAFTCVEEIEQSYRWPSPDWYDYSGIPQQIAGKEVYPIRGGGSEPFLIYKSLRGQEQAMMDLILNPEMVHHCQVVFHGGMDNQQTLAFGTVDQVRREVEENLQVLGEAGGYILAPCHNIQAVSPPENVVAMYETGYVMGRHGG